MNALKPSEILRAGLNLLETKGWTQHDYAKDARGNSVYDLNDATCFCSIGAIRVSSFGSLYAHNIGDDISPYTEARRVLHATIGDNSENPTGFAKWQDEPNRTFAEVKDKFTEAIELDEQEEKAAA